MSEFSDSYHLRSDNIEAGMDLLKRAGLKGYVFPPENGWVTVVAEGEELVPNDRLINANEGTLLYFVSAEDHGWIFSIYKGSTEVCSYSCMWEEDVIIEDRSFNEQVVLEILRDDKDKFKALKDCLYPKTFEDISELSPSTAFAGVLGLKHYEWVSFGYLDNDLEVYLKESPGIAVVE